MGDEELGRQKGRCEAVRPPPEMSVSEDALWTCGSEKLPLVSRGGVVFEQLLRQTALDCVHRDLTSSGCGACHGKTRRQC